MRALGVPCRVSDRPQRAPMLAERENMVKKNLLKCVRLPRLSSVDSAEYRTRQEAVIANGVAQITRNNEELVRRGILDADWDLIEPYDGPDGPITRK